MGIGFVRLLLGGLVLAALVHGGGGWGVAGPRLWRRPAVSAAAACVALYQVAFFAGVERAGVGVGTLTAVGSATVAAGLLAWPVLGRRPTLPWAGATAVGVAGVGLLSGAGLHGADGGGVLLSLVAGIAIAGFSVLASRVMAEGAPRLPFLACSFLLAATALAPLVVTQPFGWLPEPRGVLLAVHLGVVTMAVANIAYARGLSLLGPGPTSTLLLAEPVVALALAVLVLREPLGGVAVLGSALVVGALGLQGLATRRTPRGPVPMPATTRRDSFAADPPTCRVTAVRSARGPSPAQRSVV
jgi:DME family drug/metabolite transporter